MSVKENIISPVCRYFFILVLTVGHIFGLALPAFALGLGEIRIKSALGQSLLAHADIVGGETELINPSCLRARVVTMDGVFISSAIITIYQNSKQRALSFSTRQAINEPAVNLIIDINCQTQLHREFSILLDPPDVNASSSTTNRDESPFGLTNSKSMAKTQVPVTERVTQQDSKSVPRKKKPTTVEDGIGRDSPQLDNAPKRESKRRNSTVTPSKDVLKLSDEIESPMPSQGLRMSDVLSSDAGQRLVENMQELRAAQARMAALLRDELQTVGTAESQIDRSKEIASLRQETEQLRKQNLLDKSALLKMQEKPAFDFWLVVLALIAISAIVIILFLLVYIRRHLAGKNATWWQEEEESLSAQPEKIEDVINNLQSSYDRKMAPDASPSGALNKHRLVTQSDEEVKDVSNETKSSAPSFENSRFHRTPTLEETNSSIFNFFAPRGNSVKVEEISDVTQEAEFWISMNDPQRAIEILSAQEQLEQPDSPVPWLFLLDLYRTVNDREKYDMLRDRFIIFFNANIPEFDTDLTQVPSRQLEDFSHLTQKICDAWGSNGIIPYLESLLVDDREGKRAGFDLPVYRDILMLLGIAHELEKIVAIEGPLRGSPEVVIKKPEIEIATDPLEAAEINTIEFETIDFPIMLDKSKK